MRIINLIVIHCTASANGKPVSRETVDQWHKARGFQGIGYHWLIQPDGTVDRGRLEETPGAHAKGFNAHSIGVCLVGGIGGPDRQNPGLYTRAQWEALRLLVLELLERYPTARVVGHRDLSPDLDGDGEVEPNEWLKLCPAFPVAAWMDGGGGALESNVLVGPQEPRA